MKQLTNENLKEVNKVSGIYKIVINKHFYIGSSRNISSRLKQHRNTLRAKKHHNRTFQRCFNKYGEENLYFECVEIVQDISQLIIREKYYIETLKPDINHILDPVDIKRDKIYRKRISESKKEYFKTHDQINIKEVHQYDLNGNYIATYKSISEAAKETGRIDCTDICAVCNNRVYTARGFRWSFNKCDKLPEMKKNYKHVAVIQMDLNGNFIKEWESRTHAEEELGIFNIYKACTKGVTAGGYKWKYK